MVAPRPKRQQRRRGKGRSFQYLMYLVVIGCTIYYLTSSDEAFEDTQSSEIKPDYLRGTNNGNPGNDPFDSVQDTNKNQQEFGQENFVQPEFNVEQSKDQEMNKIVEDMKHNMVEAEREEIEKEKELILNEPLKMAEEDIEEVLENILQKKGAFVPMEGVEDMANEVKEKLESSVNEELIERSSQILQDKESELEVVAQDDRNIFKSTEGFANDLGTMEKVLQKDMNNEIDEVAEDIKNHISEMTETIEQEVLKERIGIEVDSKELKQEQEEAEQSQLNEVIQNIPEEYTESLEVLSTVNQAMEEIQRAKENLAEDQRDKLDQYVSMLEDQTKEAVENVLSQEQKSLAGITVDHVVEKVNTKLEEAAINEINEQTEQIVREKKEALAEEINDEEQFMADQKDLVQEIAKEKQRTIEEMSHEIKDSTEAIKEMLLKKRAELEQEVLEEVGVEVDEEEVEEINKEVQGEHDAKLMEALMTSVHAVSEKNDTAAEVEADDDAVNEDENEELEANDSSEEGEADDDAAEGDIVDEDEEGEADDDDAAEGDIVDEDEEEEADDDDAAEGDIVEEDEDEEGEADDDAAEGDIVEEDEDEEGEADDDAAAEGDSVEEDEEVEEIVDDELTVEGSEDIDLDTESIDTREEQELELEEEEP